MPDALTPARRTLLMLEAAPHVLGRWNTLAHAVNRHWRRMPAADQARFKDALLAAVASQVGCDYRRGTK